MEVKIGIQSARELIVETDESPAEIEERLNRALSSDPALFVLSTARGGRVLIPADKVAFIEFNRDPDRRVGFGNLV